MDTAVGQLIVAGTALGGTSIEDISRNINSERNISIKITNFSKKFTLEKPELYNFSGYCYIPPQPTIAKNTSEACAFNKTSGQGGAVGVLTYQIASREPCVKCVVADLAIMFSVPYDYSKYEHWFALGIYDGGVSCGEDLYKQMYYDSGPFTRSKAKGNAIEYSGKTVLVKGTMSNADKSVMKVEVWDV